MNVVSARPLRRVIALSAAVAVAVIGVAAAPMAQAAPDPTDPPSISAAPSPSSDETTVSPSPTSDETTTPPSPTSDETTTPPSPTSDETTTPPSPTPTETTTSPSPTPTETTAAATSTSVLSGVPASVVAGSSLTVQVVVTSDDVAELAGGTVQLLVGGKPSGAPVPVTVAHASATAALRVPTGVVGSYEISARFTGTLDSLRSTTAVAPLTVLPAALPWTLVDENGDPITSPLTSPYITARATGQLPGATVYAEIWLDGAWEADDELESGTVDIDGTVEIPIILPQLLAAAGDLYAPSQSYKLRLVAASPVDETTLRSSTRTITVPGAEVPIDLQVDPGPYRAGEGVDNAVRVKITWFGEDLAIASADDIEGMLEDGSLTLLLDRKPLDPRDIEVSEADDETAVLSIDAPPKGGRHTVQAMIIHAADRPDVFSASLLGEFFVAPSTFRAELLNQDGDAITTVHRGQKLEAAAMGLLPGTTVVFSLHSTPTTLGSDTAGPDSAVWLPVTIPDDISLGAHTFVATATDALGDTHVETVAITVVADPAAGGLAVTGSSTQPALLVGAILLLAGAALVHVARRRRA